MFSFGLRSPVEKDSKISRPARRPQSKCRIMTLAGRTSRTRRFDRAIQTKPFAGYASGDPSPDPSLDPRARGQECVSFWGVASIIYGNAKRKLMKLHDNDLTSNVEPGATLPAATATATMSPTTKTIPATKATAPAKVTPTPRKRKASAMDSASPGAGNLADADASRAEGKGTGFVQKKTKILNTAATLSCLVTRRSYIADTYTEHDTNDVDRFRRWEYGNTEKRPASY